VQPVFPFPFKRSCRKLHVKYLTKISSLCVPAPCTNLGRVSTYVNGYPVPTGEKHCIFPKETPLLPSKRTEEETATSRSCGPGEGGIPDF